MCTVMISTSDKYRKLHSCGRILFTPIKRKYVLQKIVQLVGALESVLHKWVKMTRGEENTLICRESDFYSIQDSRNVLLMYQLIVQASFFQCKQLRSPREINVCIYVKNEINCYK